MSAGEKIALLLFVLSIAVVYLSEALVLSLYALAKLRHKAGRNLLCRKPALVLHVVALLGLVCFIYGRFIEPYRIEVTVIPIETTKLKDVTFRIVHISDLHCEAEPRNEPKLVELINELKPDVIVFTGDALNTAGALPVFRETMKKLRASCGKFAVRGNFETGPLGKLDLYAQTGFELLEGKTVGVTKNGETIYISGLSCDNPAGFKPLLRAVPEGSFSVFLYHFSDLVESGENLNLDLYLCGHTHGGQVALPFYGALITLSKFGKKYESGIHRVGERILYVNRGIGLEPRPAPQVRFCARPEIAVFDVLPRK